MYVVISFLIAIAAAAVTFWLGWLTGWWLLLVFACAWGVLLLIRNAESAVDAIGDFVEAILDALF